MNCSSEGNANKKQMIRCWVGPATHYAVVGMLGLKLVG